MTGCTTGVSTPSLPQYSVVSDGSTGDLSTTRVTDSLAMTNEFGTVEGLRDPSGSIRPCNQEQNLCSFDSKTLHYTDPVRKYWPHTNPSWILFQNPWGFRYEKGYGSREGSLFYVGVVVSQDQGNLQVEE